MSSDIAGPPPIFPTGGDYPANLPFTPIDLDPIETKETQRWLSKSHSGIAGQAPKKLHIAYFRPGSSAAGRFERHSFSDGNAVESFLNTTVIDVTKGSLLLLGEESEDLSNPDSDGSSHGLDQQIHTSDTLLTTSILKKLWRRFCIHPMIMDGYKGVHGFRHQLVETHFGDVKALQKVIRTYGRRNKQGDTS